MKKNFILFFTIKEFKNVHLYKDVGLVLFYLCKEYNLNGKIVYSNEIKNKLPQNFRNLELEEIKFLKYPNIVRKLDKFSLLENIEFYKYLFKNAKKMDYLMFFHLTIEKFFMIFLYKLLNSKGKVYLKLDMSYKSLKCLNEKRNNIFVRYLRKVFLRKIDLVSSETKLGFEEILKNGINKVRVNKKIMYLPNGFDEEYLEKNKIKVKKFKEKENIIITVGRLGSEQKNTELLLKALEHIDLKEWKVLLVGPYTKEFKQIYDNFIVRNQDKKTKVILIGNIESRTLLYDYYNKAKVFVLTSRWEGSAIVYPEALRFGNYIITTDVGGARDITNNGNIGSVIEIDNEKELKDEIKKVIEKKFNLENKYNSSINYSKQNFIWNKLIKNKQLEEFFKID